MASGGFEEQTILSVAGNFLSVQCTVCSYRVIRCFIFEVSSVASVLLIVDKVWADLDWMIEGARLVGVLY